MQQYHCGFEMVRKRRSIIESKSGILEEICGKENPLYF
jgi:hypothetical protein